MDEKELQKLETVWITESIIKLHKEKGVSLSFIARNTYLSQTSITKIVQGKKRRMRPENRQALIKFICDTFGFKKPDFADQKATEEAAAKEPVRKDGAVALGVNSLFEGDDFF